MDILPWDITVAYAYNTNWHPRPILQSYSVYTPTLSEFDRSAYVAGKSPDYLIYSVKSIDRRYPFYDEPTLNLLLLYQYRVIENYSNKYLLLRKRLHPIPFRPRVYRTDTGNLGTTYSVALQPNQHTLVRLKINLTLAGKLINFFYKLPPLAIDMFDSSHNLLGSHRLVRRTATEKLLLSAYVKDAEAFEQLANRKRTTPISAFRIMGNIWFYESNFTIETQMQASNNATKK